MSIRTALLASTLLAMAISINPALGDEAAPVRKIELAGVVLSIPNTWKQQPPANRMRLAQFEIPAADGEGKSAELTVFQFGRGGGPQAQVNRWKGQFEADGREFSSVQGESRVGKYVYVEAQGTYKMPDGPPVLGRTIAVPNSRMLVAMFADSSQGNVFLKLVGPEKVVASQVKAFRASFDADSASEKPLAE